MKSQISYSIKSQTSYSIKSQTSSKTVTICSDPAAPDSLNNISQCSCAKCDSYSCFAFRNRTPCSCNRYCSLIGSKASSKISKNGVRIVESVTKEHVKKEITYDNIKDNMEKESTISNIYPRQDSSFDTAKLSAQVMNVPYNDFKQSIAHNTLEMTRNTTNLTKLDIFKRIKEAYQACSCKVCECIIGRTNECSDICKCKPCQCKDCVSVMNNFKYKGKCVRYSCDPVKCDKNECKGYVVRKTCSVPQHCNCDPCDCLECNDFINKPCNCKPCECIECKTYSLAKPKVLIVGRVEEDTPRNLCSCSPCECAECTHRAFPLTPSSRRHEMSTEISIPTNCNCDSCPSQTCETNDSGRCSCEIQKQVMSKPFQRDTLDYDIHRASIKNISIVEKPYNNTIAMFAALDDNPQKLKLFNKDCNCGDCECLVCNSKNGNATVIQNSRLYKSSLNESSCDCLPCECEVCKAANIRGPVRIPKPCTCDICDCLKCEGFINTSLNINKVTGNPKTFPTCKCKPCECTVCRPNCTENNCYRSYSESTISFDQDKIVSQDKGLTDIKPGCVYNKTKTHSRPGKNLNDYGTEEPSASHNYFNLTRHDDSGTIKYINKLNPEKSPTATQESPTAAQECNKTCLMRDMYKQCTEKYIPQFDRNMSDTYSDISEYCVLENSQYNNFRDKLAVTVQSNVTKPKKHNDIISSYTTRRLIGGSVDKCLNDITKMNINTTSTKTKSILDNQGMPTDNSNTKNLPSEYTENNNITLSSNNTRSRSKSGMDKYSDKDLQNKQRHLLNSEKITERVVGSLNLASKTNKAKINNLKESLISESETYKEPTPSNIIKHTSKNPIDFEKVKHSLQQAKEFSIELIKLLKQYEKANDDYYEYSNKFSKKYDVHYTGRKESEKCDAPFRTKFHHNIRTVDSYSSNSIIEKDELHKSNPLKNNNLGSSTGYNLPTTSNKLELIDFLLSEDNKKYI
ncbi:unnamed protein product [Chilo suppressalis]|uniref:CRC domain-containing protein n=1 Tax=Chilo suppressalis TaxID=168631 RepID=A0ABN8AZX3_CHISP|nr:unnamed protein product [Chilo suppressalis]